MSTSDAREHIHARTHAPKMCMQVYASRLALFCGLLLHAASDVMMFQVGNRRDDGGWRIKGARGGGVEGGWGVDGGGPTVPTGPSPCTERDVCWHSSPHRYAGGGGPGAEG